MHFTKKMWFAVWFLAFALILQAVVAQFRSPLDEGGSTVEQPSFWAYGDEFSSDNQECETACNEPLMNGLRVFFEPGNIRDSMIAACKYYNDLVECMRPLTHCSESIFSPLTSGVRYMCVEQREAFDALIGCVDMNSAIVQRDCDLTCQPNTLLTGLALKDTVMRSIDQPIGSSKVNLNMRELIEPHLGNIFFSEGCRITQCLMNCYKTKFNMLCEGSAGSILMEMLTRPLASEAVPKSAPQFLSNFLGGLLPRTCSFLYSKNGGLRIDPDLDKEIKRMYKDRKITAAADLAASVGGPASELNPFLNIDQSFLRVSPIENDAWKLFTDSQKDPKTKAEPITKRLKEPGMTNDKVSRFVVEEEGSGENAEGTSQTANNVTEKVVSLKLNDAIQVEPDTQYNIELDVHGTKPGDTVMCELETEVDEEGSGSGSGLFLDF